MHCIGLASHIACLSDTSGVNHINIVAASLTRIHKIKNLKKNLYICTAVNNTGKLIELQEPK